VGVVCLALCLVVVLNDSGAAEEPIVLASWWGNLGVAEMASQEQHLPSIGDSNALNEIVQLSSLLHTSRSLNVAMGNQRKLHGLNHAQEKENSLDNVHVSPPCAAVVLVSSGAVGAGVAWALAPIVMGMAGFSAIGPAAGSWAASWQATMPLVAQGSLFAVLQSAAMAGIGTTTIVSAASLGGLAGATLITRICTAVDTVKPGSPEAQAVDLVYTAVRNTGSSVKDGTKAATSSIDALYAAVNNAAKSQQPNIDALYTSVKDAPKAAKSSFDAFYASVKDAPKAAKSNIDTLDASGWVKHLVDNVHSFRRSLFERNGKELARQH